MLARCLQWLILFSKTYYSCEEASRARVAKYKKKSIEGFKPGIFRLRREYANHYATRSDVDRMVKSQPAFISAIFRNLPVARG